MLACESALGDYQAGLLDDTELRRALERAGIAHTETGAWFLDIESRQWRPYLPVPPDLSFDARTVRRWLLGLRQLMTPAVTSTEVEVTRRRDGVAPAR